MDRLLCTTAAATGAAAAHFQRHSQCVYVTSVSLQEQNVQRLNLVYVQKRNFEMGYIWSAFSVKVFSHPGD